MNSYVVDANVWLALVVDGHPHSARSVEWFEGIAVADAAICRIVQLALMRLLANRTVMGDAVLSASQAWSRVVQLLQDERVIFLPEPRELETILPSLLRYPVPTQNLINDAYLAAFAICSNRELVTWDRGFQQFRGLRVKLLNA